MTQETNGLYRCEVSESWNEFKNKVNDMHTVSKAVATYLPHLEKLDSLERMENHLMDVATSKNQIETKTVMFIFKILGAVILALLLVIVFLLTGEHLGLLSGLHHP